MNQDENNFISLNINTDELIQINSSDYCDVFITNLIYFLMINMHLIINLRKNKID